MKQRNRYNAEVISRGFTGSQIHLDNAGENVGPEFKTMMISLGIRP